MFLGDLSYLIVEENLFSIVTEGDQGFTILHGRF